MRKAMNHGQHGWDGWISERRNLIRGIREIRGSPSSPSPLFAEASFRSAPEAFAIPREAMRGKCGLFEFQVPSSDHSPALRLCQVTTHIHIRNVSAAG